MSHLNQCSREGMMFRFVIEPAKDGCLQVRSKYAAGDRVAEFVELQLRALIETVFKSMFDKFVIVIVVE